MHPRYFIFGLVACAALQVATLTSLAQGPAPVYGVSRPVEQDVVDYAVFTGRAEPSQTVELRPQIGGVLVSATFPAGGMVLKGAVLFEIESRLQHAEVARAEAGIARAEALLKASAADLERARALFAAKNIAKEEIDRAALKHSEAQADHAAARASLELAQIQLQRTKIVAPCTGRISRPAVDPGNVVIADTTKLATLVNAQPLFIYFDMDEGTILQLRNLRQDGKGPKEVGMPVAIALMTDKDFPHTGKVDAVDVRIDAATGTQRWRAVLDNKDDVILPGQAVRVKLALGTPTKGLLVADFAVLRIAKGGGSDDTASVLVVNDQNVVENRSVTVGAVHAGLRHIRSGLKPTDRLVVSGRPLEGGTTQVRAGMTITPRELVMPLQPLPTDSTTTTKKKKGGDGGKDKLPF